MKDTLAPGSTIGILGGGQLGRMLAVASARLGYRCVVLSPEDDPPAAVVARHMRADYEDEAALAAFAAGADVVTFEFENVSARGLALLEALVPVRPSARVLGISQDRVAEKAFLNGAGVATAPWIAVEEAASLEALGWPLVLKTRRLGYDGKGQALVRSADAADAAIASLGGSGLIAEGFVDFALEMSVIVARGLDGTMRAFDPVENRHRDGILDLTLAPARVTDEIARDATALALRTAEALDLVGLLAVEMFVDRQGRVIVNEIAPRPHNSGHWTLDACGIDQFEMQVRAVCGLPLPAASRHSDAVMRNLIGPDGIGEWAALLGTPGALLHHYGKAEARAGRKMGHVTHLFPRGALPGDLGIGEVARPGAPPLDPTGAERPQIV
jgi:5-(carboxyamino)imidazole ribonucleotide synthase